MINESVLQTTLDASFKCNLGIKPRFNQIRLHTKKYDKCCISQVLFGALVRTYKQANTRCFRQILFTLDTRCLHFHPQTLFQMKHKIFVSYSKSDGLQFAEKLVHDLRKSEVDVWIDQKNIHGGSSWHREIEKAVKSSTCVLFIVSEQSINSDYVLAEVQLARDNQKVVIPIMIFDCSVPYPNNALQRIDFTKDYNAGFSRLIGALEGKAAEATDRSAGSKYRTYFNAKKQCSC